MAVSLFFGLPGSGKTTVLTYLAKKALKNKRYKYVYSNVQLQLPGIIYIDNECIGKYHIEDALILVDEATLFADSRAYKTFPTHLIQFFLLHRHYNVDITLFTQQWDGVDKKIRVITDRVYYVYKGFFTGHWFTKFYRIPYGIIIPDKAHSSEKLGEIIQGYCKPPLLVRMFATKVYRPSLYKYFDSWEAPHLKDMPFRYHPLFKYVDGVGYSTEKSYRRAIRRYKIKSFFIVLNKRCILLRSFFLKIFFNDRVVRYVTGLPLREIQLITAS